MEIFTKLLTKSDIESKLVVPTTALQHFSMPEGGHCTDLMVTDSTGQGWPFRLYIRASGRYPKPLLTTGWLQFVRTKGLQVGDEVIFSKEEEKYKIEVKRHTFVLFGKHIQAEVDQLVDPKSDTKGYQRKCDLSLRLSQNTKVGCSKVYETKALFI
ncbi:hypothetical protein ACOSQ2_004590 [Xanthoceras sorbifolium]